MTVPLVARALALGLAAGSRASLGVAAPLLADPRTPPRVRVGLGLGVAGELVGDKLPWTPSRLENHGADGRAASGALGGVLLARRRRAGGGALVAAGLAGAVGGVVGTGVGAAWRSAVASRGWADLPAALAEDAVALALAAWAARG